MLATVCLASSSQRPAWRASRTGSCCTIPRSGPFQWRTLWTTTPSTPVAPKGTVYAPLLRGMRLPTLCPTDSVRRSMLVSLTPQPDHRGTVEHDLRQPRHVPARLRAPRVVPVRHLRARRVAQAVPAPAGRRHRLPGVRGVPVQGPEQLRRWPGRGRRGVRPRPPVRVQEEHGLARRDGR